MRRGIKLEYDKGSEQKESPATKFNIMAHVS